MMLARSIVPSLGYVVFAFRALAFGFRDNFAPIQFLSAQLFEFCISENGLSLLYRGQCFAALLLAGAIENAQKLSLTQSYLSFRRYDPCAVIFIGYFGNDLPAANMITFIERHPGELARNLGTHFDFF